MKIISISGGRSSAMMLKILQDNGMVNQPDTVVCFANTGKESPETLSFIHECSIRWGIPVVWLEYQSLMPKFKITNYYTASRIGEPFEQLLSKRSYLPNPTQRICTAELKIKTIRRYVRSLGHKGTFDTFIGLRYDEPDRVARKKAQNDTGKEAEVCFMPLYDMRITKKERDEFWKHQGFDLQIHSAIDNCDLCFMKSKMEIIWSIRENPALADWWIEQERRSAQSAKRRKNGQFRKEYSYAELKDYAIRQTYINVPRDRKQSVTCSCTD